MSRLLFWAAAAVISAGVAYAVTVPGVLERPEPLEEAGPEATEAPEQAPPEAREGSPARQAETVEATLSRVEPLPRNAEQAQRREARAEAEAEPPRQASAGAEERDEAEADEGAGQQTAAVPAGPFAEPVLQAPTGMLPAPQAPAAGPSEDERASSLAAGPLATPQPARPSAGTTLGRPSPAAGPLAAPRPPQQPRRATIDELTLETLSFSAECGLILRRLGEREVIFAAGVSLDPMGAPAAISLDGEMVALRRVGVDGEPLGFSQFSRQLFQDEAERLQVLLEIALEEEAGSGGDSARVSGGEVTVAVGDRPIAQIDVGGRAGC